ncbi:unnamed protein product [Paramecium sonneborni]|uniref:Uncharacterized protein n=1 Tax=Paramecium sonneborni TaxID=65129 RepID=A0A8S1JXU6_9CILI|nr:unnamed protein product [Paramecium sonneborni]
MVDLSKEKNQAKVHLEWFTFAMINGKRKQRFNEFRMRNLNYRRTSRNNKYCLIKKTLFFGQELIFQKISQKQITYLIIEYYLVHSKKISLLQELQNIRAFQLIKVMNYQEKIIQKIQDMCLYIYLEGIYHEYVYKLKFGSTTNYKHSQSLFKKIAKYNNISFDRKYDWMDDQTSSTKSSDQAQQSFNDIDILNQQSDYLQFPDLKKNQRYKTNQIDQTSQQSSVILNYNPSIISRRNIRNLNFQKSRQNSKQSFSRESSIIKQPLGQKLQDQIFENREFRDFDDQENKEKINQINFEFNDFENFDDEIFDDLQIHQEIQKVGFIQVHFKEHISKQ